MNTRTYVMNVNMVEHQRSIMTAMGIDIWMPKTDVNTRAYSNSLYRDQAAPETNAFQNFINLNDLQDHNNLHHNNLQNQALPQVDNIQALKQEKSIQPLAKNLNIETTAIVTESSTSISVETRPVFNVDTFELHALCLDSCVIVVDVTGMSTEQNQLWRNIQSAIQGQYFQLKWPFAVMNLQDGRGAKSYIQGFLDAISVEKTKICLGRLPHTPDHSMLELPNLQEMLEQPILKAQLWKMMQK